MDDLSRDKCISHCTVLGRAQPFILLFVSSLFLFMILSEFTSTALITVVVLAALAIPIAVVRSRRLSVIARADTLEVRNPFRTVIIKWSDVTKVVRFGGGISAPRLQTAQGKRVTLVALTSGRIRKTSKWVECSEKIPNLRPEASSVLDKIETAAY